MDAVALQALREQHPSGLQGKHKQAMCAKNREWYSGSSSSNGREEWKSQEQEEIKRLRAQIDLLSKQQGAGKSLEELGEPARSGSGLEEGSRVEFEEETEFNKKLDEQKKSLQRQMREIDKFANMDPVFRDQQKEAWKKELEEMERKRTELCWSIRRCRRLYKSCKNCGISRGSTSKRPEVVKKTCKRSMKSGRNRKHITRRASEFCLKARRLSEIGSRVGE